MTVPPGGAPERQADLVTPQSRLAEARNNKQRIELTKLVSQINGQREELERSSRRPDVDSLARECVNELLAETGWGHDVDTAHDYKDRLAQLRPLVASDEDLHALLNAELNREESPEEPTISRLFGRESILALHERLQASTQANPEPVNDRDRREARALLKELYRQTGDGRRHHRAVTKLRGQYLHQYFWVLLVPTALVGLAIRLLGSGENGMWERLLLVASAGALGSTLTAAYRLRDFVGPLLLLQAVKVLLFLQPLIGGALGIVSWLVLTGNLVQIAELDNGKWETQGLLAFVSGLSEPFILRVVGRTIGIEADQATQTRANI